MRVCTFGQVTCSCWSSPSTTRSRSRRWSSCGSRSWTARSSATRWACPTCCTCRWWSSPTSATASPTASSTPATWRRCWPARPTAHAWRRRPRRIPMWTRCSSSCSTWRTCRRRWALPCTVKWRPCTKGGAGRSRAAAWSPSGARWATHAALWRPTSGGPASGQTCWWRRPGPTRRTRAAPGETPAAFCSKGLTATRCLPHRGPTEWIIHCIRHRGPTGRIICCVRHRGPTGRIMCCVRHRGPNGRIIHCGRYTGSMEMVIHFIVTEDRWMACNTAWTFQNQTCVLH